MNVDVNPAPEGASCTADTDIGNPEPTPCGKPAVVVMFFTEGLEDVDDDPLYLCTNCQLERARTTQERDQAEAFEEQHGYPPNCDLQRLAWLLGNRSLRLERLLVLNAPVVILRGSRQILKRTERHIWSWLAVHKPTVGSHIAAVNLMLEDVEKNYVKVGDKDNKKALLEGLKAARRIACALEIERAVKRSHPE